MLKLLATDLTPQGNALENHSARYRSTLPTLRLLAFSDLRKFDIESLVGKLRAVQILLEKSQRVCLPMVCTK
jgi:hypothetical protein